MTGRAIEVLGWHAPVPGSDRHVGAIRSGSLDWQDGARCAETDYAVFFPDPRAAAGAALRVCAACEVRARCLEWALATGQEYGIWGGVTEKARRKMTAARNSGRNGLAA